MKMRQSVMKARAVLSLRQIVLRLAEKTASVGKVRSAMDSGVFQKTLKSTNQVSAQMGMRVLKDRSVIGMQRVGRTARATRIVRLIIHAQPTMSQADTAFGFKLTQAVAQKHRDAATVQMEHRPVSVSSSLVNLIKALSALRESIRAGMAMAPIFTASKKASSVNLMGLPAIMGSSSRTDVATLRVTIPVFRTLVAPRNVLSTRRRLAMPSSDLIATQECTA